MSDVTFDELDRALEVAQNTGGWSYEEAELMARALLTVTAGRPTLRLADCLVIGRFRFPLSSEPSA